MCIRDSLKPGIAVLEEVHDLIRGGKAGVDVGFGGLGAHLLRRGEHPPAEFFVQLGLDAGGDVGNVFQVFAFGQGLHHSLLVNHLLAGGIDQRRALGHRHQQVVADRAFGLLRRGDMQREVRCV